MKKGDILIVVLLILVALGGAGYVLINDMNQTDRYVVITHNQEELYRIKINDQYDEVIKYEAGDELNEIHIKDGRIWIEYATCNNQVCVRSAAIERVGQSIVCLPHKLIVEIKGQGKSSVDIISE